MKKHQGWFSGKMLFYFISIAAVVVVVAFSIHFYRFLNTPEAQMEKALVKNYVCLLDLKELKVLEKATKNYSLGNEKIKTASSKYIKSLHEFYIDNGIVYSYLNKSKTLISVYYQREDIAFLSISAVAKKDEKKVERFLKKNLSSSCSEFFTYKGVPVYQITVGKQVFYLYYRQLLWVTASNKNLIRRSINQLQNPEVQQLPCEGLKSDNNVYFSIKNFFDLAKGVANNCSNKDYLELLSRFGYANLNFENKEKILTLNGRMALLEHEKEIPTNTLTDYRLLLPSGVVKLIYMDQQYLSYFKPKQSNTVVAQELFNDLQPTSLFAFSIDNDSLGRCNYLIIKPKNYNNATKKLLIATEHYLEKENFKGLGLDTVFYGANMIGKIDLANFVYLRWAVGADLPKLKAYTLWGEYIVFSQNVESVMLYLSKMVDNSRLMDDCFFASTDDFFVKKVNALAYQHNQVEKEVFRFQLYRNNDSTYFCNMLFQNTED